MEESKDEVDSEKLDKYRLKESCEEEVGWQGCGCVREGVEW